MEGWLTMVRKFEALGEEAGAMVDQGSPRVEALLAERDALLAQLSAALASDAARSTDRTAMAPVTNALESANASTATLIAKVAERTDALRAELRELSRGARASDAYLSSTDVRGRLNARR
jgi:hypothetical protein